MNHRQQYSHYFESRSAYEDALFKSFKARDEAVAKLDNEKNELFDKWEICRSDKEKLDHNLRILLESLPPNRVIWTKEQKKTYSEVRSKLNQAIFDYNEINKNLAAFLNKCSDVTDQAFDESWNLELEKAKNKIVNLKNLANS